MKGSLAIDKLAENEQSARTGGSGASESTYVSLRGVDVVLMASGHEVTNPRIYARQALSLQGLGANVIVVGRLEHRPSGEAQVLAVSAPSSRLVRFLWQPWRCLWAARHLNPDVFHFHDAEMLTVLPIAKLWWRRSKFIYDAREDFGNMMLVRDWLPSAVKPAVRFLTEVIEPGLARLADAIVGVTPPLTAKFRHPKKIVAYNFVPDDFFEQTARAKRDPRMREFDVVHLGTLNLRRAAFLAETLREFHRLRPRARSLVIGASREIEAALRPQVPDGCVLLGKTPYGEIPGLLGNAKVGLDVHPWLGPHLEVALAVKVCEYMAAGCAVVASTMPVLNKLLAEAGAGSDSISIIEGGEPSKYARAVLRLVEAIERGDDPGARLRALAFEHLRWENEVVKIARLYLQLLDKPCVTHPLTAIDRSL
jgi:glycosyltransferase involved in cell wall biosynthesis